MAHSRILVVEDEPHVARDIQLKLEDCGYRVVAIASSGEAALQATARHHPDLVLMDIVLEGPLDGIDTAQQINDTYNTPVIYLTAHAEEDRLQRAKITDPFGYVLKPVHARELHAAILLALHKAEMTRQLQQVASTHAALMGICDAVIVLDCNGHITDLNPSAESMLRTSLAATYGQELSEIITLNIEGSPSTLKDIIPEVTKTGISFSCERNATLLFNNDETTPVHFSVSPIFNTGHALIGSVCVIHDDTERSSAERDLRESENKFRTLAETSDSLIMVYRDKLLYANRACEEYSGYSRDELKRMQLLDLIHPDQRDHIADALQQRLSGNAAPRSYLIKFITKSGTTHWVELNTARIDYEGKPAGMASGLDVTDKTRYEAGNRKIAYWVERLLGATTDEAGFYRIACEGIVDLVNADISALPCLNNHENTFTYRTAFGEKAALLINKSMPIKDGGLCGWVAEHGQTLRVPDLSADSRVIPELACALDVTTALVTPLLHENAVIGGLSAFRKGEPFDAIDQELLVLFSQRVSLAFGNMRQLRLLERHVADRTRDLENSNAELEAFSYSVSHDLRAPLRSINGFCKALLEDYADTLDKTGRDYLERITGNATRMGHLIDDLLALSQVSRIELQKQAVDLTALTKSIIKSIQERSPRTQQVDISIKEGVLASGDARLLRVALNNILDNAWKFTAKTPEPAIEFGTAQRNGETVYFVRDNGAGFEMNYVSKLFRPFQRLHSDKEFEGTGIGLATVRRVIQRHGGEAWAEGAPSQGATIYFTLS